MLNLIPFLAFLNTLAYCEGITDYPGNQKPQRKINIFHHSGENMQLATATGRTAIRWYPKTGTHDEPGTILEVALPKQNRENTFSYDEGIEMVKKLIGERRFPEAEGILREMLHTYPDNVELMSMLARVLFWQKKYEDAIGAFRKVLTLQDDDSLRKELERAEIAKILADVDEMLKKGDIQTAKGILNDLFTSKREQYQSGYRLGMLHIRERQYEKAVEIFKELKTLFPEDRGFQALYLESLILAGDIQKAKSELRNLPVDTRDSLKKEREDLFYRVRRNFSRFRARSYSPDQAKEREVSFEVAQRIKEMTFVVSSVHLRRFGLWNQQFGLDIYSKVGEKTKGWGVLSFSMSPRADFLPKTTLAGEVYHAFRNSELSLGYQRMNFERSSVDIIGPGVILYLPRRFTLSEKLYLVPKTKAYSLLSTLYYEPNHKFMAFYSFSFGTSAERIRTRDDLRRFSTRTTKTGLEYRFNPLFSIGMELSFEYRKFFYSRYGVAVYSRVWW